jgi:hypothetical protein
MSTETRVSTETTCYVVPVNVGKPVRASDAYMAFHWGDDIISERLSSGGLEVAPGVTIAVLSVGDGQWGGEGASARGALIAVRTRTPCTCGALGEPGHYHVSPCPQSAAVPAERQS